MGDSPSSGDAGSGRSPCARIESEIASASERLRATAQNFSLEWKSFLSYAMKMKASGTGGGADGGDATGQRGLEDLLLHSQSGLVMLREMQTRRDRKWREICERYGYEHPSVESTGSQADFAPSVLQGSRPNSSPAAPLTNQLVRALAAMNSDIADAARVVLSTQRLDLPFAAESPLSAASILGAVSSDGRKTRIHCNASAQYVLVRVRTQAIATANKLETMERRMGDQNRPDQVQSQLIDPCDVEELMQVTFERQQLQIALGRLFTRMKWMCTSHRYHLRHRMLSLVHQHLQKTDASTPRKTGEAATTAGGTNDGQSCPLLATQTKQSAEVDLEVLLRVEHSLTIPRGKRNEMDSFALKQTIDELFRRGLEATTIDRQSTDEQVPPESGGGRSVSSDLGDSGGRLVVERATWSRWDLLQAPYFLGSPANDVKQAARDQRRGLSSIDSVEDDRDIDAILNNEWRLLQLNDATYMRSRLESLADNHEHRATITIPIHEPGSSRTIPLTRPSTNDGRQPTILASANQQSPERSERPKTASSATIDPLKAVLPAATNGMSEPSTVYYSLYALRVLSSRSQRHRLLRLLNYAHYLLHVSRQASVAGSTVDAQRPQKQTLERETALPAAQEWRISMSSNGEYIVLQESTRLLNNSEDAKSADSEAKEFIFDGAWQDLRVLERQMMRIGSHFIRKQEHSHFRQYEDPTGTMSAYAFPAVDRLQVLHDLFACQIEYQTAKLQLVELLLGNGLLGYVTTDDEHSGLHIIMSILRNRPIIDFTHGYFVESFASETIQLELQIRLQQQLRSHLFNMSKARCDQGREHDARLALTRYSQSAKSVARFWSLQEKLIDQAETKWFVETSVMERHALRQSVYEQLLVTWQLITKLEIPSAPIHALERSAVDIFSGNGLQVVLPPALLIDTSRQLHARAQGMAHNEGSVSKSSPLGRSVSEWLAAAWLLMEWHQVLAHSIYEAGLLDRVYRFQYSFVREMEHANEQAHLLYFDAAGGSNSNLTARDGHTDRDSMTSTLTPIAIQLGLVEACASESKSTHLDSSHKTVPNWIEQQLWTSMMGQERPVDAKAEFSIGIGRTDAILLRLQRQWVEYIGVRVDFHDRVAAHVFEFASSSSFIALEAMRQRQYPTKQATAVFTDVDVDMVRVKYANDVAHKMTEEMQQQCYPYWTCLDTLKQQLRSQHGTAGMSDTAATEHDDSAANDTFKNTEDEELERIEQRDHVGVVVQVENADACCRFMSDTAAAPRLLAQLDELLQRLRNEAQLALSCNTHGVCPFIIPTDGGDGDEVDRNPNPLTKWFVSKFDQLKKDLHVHDKSTRSPSTADYTDRQSGTFPFGVNTTADSGCEDEDDDDSDGRDSCVLLLRSVPSFSLLLRQFMPSRHEPALHSSEPRATNRSVHASLREDSAAEEASLEQKPQEAIVAALRGLVAVYSALVQLVELWRVHCALLGDVHQQNRMPTQVSTDDLEGLGAFHANCGDEAGRRLLVQWQCQFYGHVRERLREMARRMNTQVCAASMKQDGKTTKQSLQSLALFVSPLLERDVHRVHASLTLRLEAERVAQHFLDQERELARFVLTAASMQTFGGGLEGRQKRLFLLELDEIVAAEGEHLRDSTATDFCTALDAPSRRLQAADRLRKALFRFPLFVGQKRSPQRQLQQAELQNLWDTVSATSPPPPAKTVATPISSVAIMSRLLRLQRVFLEEHIDHQVPIQDLSPASATAKSSLSYTNGEATALRSLTGAWEIFRAIDLALSNDESLSDDMFARLRRQPSMKAHGGDSRSRPHNTPGVVSGDSLRLKIRLLGDRGVPSTDMSAESVGPTRWIALECLTLGQQTHALVTDPAATITVERGLCLPSEVRSREYVRWLHGALELAWIHRDMGDMQAHYDTLLQYRKQHHQHRLRASPADTHLSAASPSNSSPLSILRLASLFIDSGPDSACESNSSSSSVSQLRQRDLVEAYDTAVTLGFQQCEQLEREARDLRCRLQEAEVDTDAKREAYAVDYAYALHFKMQALHQQLDVVHRRAEADRAAVRCELSDEYAEKLQTLRVQLLAAGAQFDDFRSKLQSQLTHQLQLAQTHAIEQLVDGGEPGAVSAMVSASLSVPAKAALLASLTTKQQQITGLDGGSAASSSALADTSARLERENAAMKRSILRLQALVAVQQQVQAGTRDRELEMTRRHAASDALSRHELGQLRAQITQLQSDVSRLAQEKARAQLRVARLEQERDQTTQRRREAKARALSAPYYRSEAAGRYSNYVDSDTEGDGFDPMKAIQSTNAIADSGETNQAAVTASGVAGSSGGAGRRRLAPSSAPATTAGQRAFSIHGGTRTSKSTGPDWEEMEEAFETENERAIRSPVAVSGAEDDEEAARSLAERCQRSMHHQQNEIRRLQQQLARESKLKTEALRQLADIKVAVRCGDQQDNDSVDKGDTEGSTSIGGDGALDSKAMASPQQQQVQPAIPPSPRRAQSAAPYAAIHRRVLASGNGAPLPSTPTRPSTSFSARASSLSSSIVTQDQSRHGISSSPRQDTARPQSTRGKFHIVRPARETQVGGVAGVPNALSVREPLPYR